MGRLRTVAVFAPTIILVVGFLLLQQFDRTGSNPEPPTAESSSATVLGDAAIVEAFEQRRSELMVETAGIVERTLEDDLDGSRHQRFIVRLENGHTVLLSHNIDLAKRVPLQRGDRVGFRGQFEWNAQGGVIHWTHHDPQDRRPGGWIRLGDQTYR